MCFRLFGVEHKMPLFYFEVCSVSPWVDGAGLELANLDAAQCGSIRFCGESKRDMNASLRAELPFQVNVRDVGHRCVIALNFTASTPIQEVACEEAWELAQ